MALPPKKIPPKSYEAQDDFNTFALQYTDYTWKNTYFIQEWDQIVMNPAYIRTLNDENKAVMDAYRVYLKKNK